MINHRIGFSFALPVVIVGVIIILAGLISAIESPILGVVLILAGSFIITSSYGTQIDVDKNQFREYGSIFGIKNGEWKSLNKMPNITVLKNRIGVRVYSQSNRSTVNTDDSYEVCLLNESHRAKVTIQKFETEHQALKYGEQLASKLKKEVVHYNPVVSKTTQNRRRRR